MILVLWPDRRWVSEDTIKVWASDILFDEEQTERAPDKIDIDEAIEIVNHYGAATTSTLDYRDHYILERDFI